MQLNAVEVIMRAEKEMGMQMQTAMEMEMGEGRKGRGFIGREVRRVPPLPSLPFFFVIYIMCGEANRDKLPKDGGEAGSRIIGWTI